MKKKKKKTPYTSGLLTVCCGTPVLFFFLLPFNYRSKLMKDSVSMISKKGLAILTGQRAGQFPLYLSPSQLNPKMVTGVLDLVYVYVFLHVTVETCICTLSKNPVVLRDVPKHMHQFPFLMLRCPRASRSQAFNTGFLYQTLCTEISQNFLTICKIDCF